MFVIEKVSENIEEDMNVRQKMQAFVYFYILSLSTQLSLHCLKMQTDSLCCLKRPSLFLSYFFTRIYFLQNCMLDKRRDGWEMLLQEVWRWRYDAAGRPSVLHKFPPAANLFEPTRTIRSSHNPPPAKTGTLSSCEWVNFFNQRFHPYYQLLNRTCP